mgnify:FL=1|nr:MAG TPA: hypothetical protein [Caudoviricetes sp.]
MNKDQITISYSRFKGKQVFDCINFTTFKSFKTFKHIKTKIFLTTDSNTVNIFNYLYDKLELENHSYRDEYLISTIVDCVNSMIVEDLEMISDKDNDLALIYVNLDRNQTKILNLISELQKYLNERDNKEDK